MKTLKYFLIALLVPAFVLTGCKEDSDEDTQSAYELMTEYMTANNMDLNNIIGTKGEPTFFVTKAPATADEIDTWAAKYHIIDIRSSEEYGSGHIVGAVNSSLGGILDVADDEDLPILVVCYSGQTACYATSLLRLYGYSDAKALKWGMSGWNEDGANNAKGWNNATGDLVPNSHSDIWNTTEIPSVAFDAPSISSSLTDGASILKQRVEAVLSEGFKIMPASTVLEGHSNYFINNYFSATDHTNFGHIDGSYRIQPLTITGGETLNLNPSKEIITYCYTGQTSAVITAFLNVVGYNAYSLKAGMNALYHSNSAWSSNQWGVDSHPHDYETTTE